MARNDNALPLFAMNADQNVAYTELMDDVVAEGANCLDITPSPWVDYGDEDDPFPEPSSVDAAVMCSGCPVVEGCFIFAKTFRPTHGVWGGVKFRHKMGRM